MSHLKADNAAETQSAADYCSVREREVLEERRRVPSVLLVCVCVCVLLVCVCARARVLNFVSKNSVI